MKKFIRILSFVLCMCIGSGSIAAYAMEERESSYGYIFMTEDATVELYSVDTDGVAVISENIYHADTLEDIEKFVSLDNVAVIAEDCPVELYAYPTDDLWHMDACNVNTFLDNGITGKDVTIGVVDTGVYREHEVFTDIDISTGANMCAYLDKNESGYNNTEDTNGHGTAVTSIITNIAQDATIIPLSIYDTSSKYSLTASSILFAMQYALYYDVDVLNFSAGFSNPSDSLIEIAQGLVDKLNDNGTLIIAASGNAGLSDNTLSYPAACDGVIGVAAARQSDDTYIRAAFSTANETVDVTAPGYGIWAADISGENMYMQRDGTSFSAPIVMALAAGVKQMDADMDTDSFMELLTETSIDLDEQGYDIYTGYGLINFSTVYTTLSEELKGIYMAAAYNKAGQLLDIHMANRSSIKRVADTMAAFDEAATVKCFRWDSLDTMIPLQAVSILKGGQ